MSLDNSESTARRPLPPSKSKRRSLLISPATAGTSSGIQSGKGDSDDASHQDRTVGVMGGLRERTEEELNRASREDMAQALRSEWRARDELLELLDSLKAETGEQTKTRQELERKLKGLAIREKESLQEQDRLETDMEMRNDLVVKLRQQLAEAEMQARETLKRATEQEASFEAERQALQAQENHLQQRIRILTSEKRTEDRSSVEADDTMANLQEELGTLNTSYSTLVSHFNTLSKEVWELRQTNSALKEENEGWEFLVRERTFSGKIRDGAALHSAPLPEVEEPNSTPRRSFNESQLEALDEEMEMDELHSDLDAQSPILDEEHMFIKDLDGPSDMAHNHHRSASGHLAPPSSAKKKQPRGENLGDLPLTSSGLDLAAELGRAEIDLGGDQMRVLGKGDEGEAMRAEIKNLREANKALTLYCSKIIDRIVTHEGFEQVLSVDYKTRRLDSRSASGKGRGGQSLKELSSAMQSAVPLQTAQADLNVQSRPLVSEPAGSGGEASNDPAEEPKKPNRRFSLDIRNLGFGLPSLTSPAEPKPNPALRPLTLATKATGSSSAPTVLPPSPADEKGGPEEEDEVDKRDRHRMEAHLRLMGIERPTGGSESPGGVSPTAPVSNTGSTSWLGRKFSLKRSSPSTSVPGARASSSTGGSRHTSTASLASPQPVAPSPDMRDGTPLSRLSSHLGSMDDIAGQARMPPGADPSAQSIEAALKSFDQQEADRAKALAKGKAIASYTTPSPESMRRSSGSGSGSAGGRRRRESRDTMGGSRSGSRGIRESESSNTIWSIGSDGREV